MPKYPLRISTECELEFRKPAEGAIKLARLLPHVGRIRVEVPGEPDKLLRQTVEQARKATRAPLELHGVAAAMQAAPPEAVVWLQRLTVPDLDEASLQALLGAVQAEGLLPEVTGLEHAAGSLKSAAQALRGVDNALQARKWDHAAEKADRLASQHPWIAPLLVERFAAHPLARFGHQQPSAPQAPAAAPAPKPTRQAPPKGDPPAADCADEALGAHWIGNLAPQASWDLLIEEAGGRGRGRNRDARLVALLLPSEPGLTARPGEHRAPAEGADHAARLTELAAAPVGVFGLEPGALAGADRGHGVAELIAWVVRLLPVAGPTHIRLHAGHKRSARWAEAIGQGLRQSDSRRAPWLTLEGPEPVGKKDPFAAYAVSVAHAWAQDGLGAESPLTAHGLSACLLAGPADHTRLLLDDLHGRRGPDGDAWDALLRGAGPLVDALRGKLSDRAVTDDHLWRRYLRHTLNHLAQGQADDRLLRAQVDFLAAANTHEKHTLGARIRLARDAAALRLAVRSGIPAPEAAQGAATHADAVLAEDPRAACAADLARAEHAALSLDFAAARDLLAPWAARDAMVLGARLRARVLAALGRQAAFLGDATAAEQVDGALAALDGLSQPEDRAREAEPATADRALVAMDDPAVSDADAQAWVEKTTGPLDSRAARLATSRRRSDRAAHHLMLRLLIQRPQAFAEIRAAVLEARPKWAHKSSGHPWALIELYRALLLDDAGEFEAAKEHAVQGASVAFAAAQVPARRLVGAVVHAVATRWGVDWPDRDDTLLRLETALPKAGAHVEAIRTFCATPDTADPRALLRAALPFSLR